MKKVHIFKAPARANDINFDELYDEISNNWQERARKLRIRRWRALKHEVSGHGRTYTGKSYSGSTQAYI
jgi:hypothetical protein